MKLRVYMLVFIIFTTSCADAVVDEKKGLEMASAKISQLKSNGYFSAIDIDVDKLPEPDTEYQGNNLLVEYKDEIQNIWIVIVVPPNGQVEVSHTKLN